MTTRQTFLPLLSLLLIATPALAANPAHTGVFASADSAETAYSNPAGMVRLDQTSKTLQGIFAYGFAEFDVDKSATTVDGGNPDSDNTPVIIPAFYYVKPLNEDWRFGFSMNVPSGFGSNHGSDWAGRYYSDSFTLVYVGLTPSLAYRIDEHWSVGASLNITYSYTESVLRVNNLEPGRGDGKLVYEGDDTGYTGTLSLLYQWDDATRLGLSYTGETTTDVEGDLELSRLGPLMDATLGRLDGKTIEAETIMPQRLQLGLYHQFDSGRYLTVDMMWIDFSEFATGAISLEGEEVTEQEGIYKDMGVLTLGFGVPLTPTLTGKLGAMYLSAGVDDDKRTLSLGLDEVFAFGAGVSQQRESSRLDANVNIYLLGDAPVDTGAGSPLRGRVVGETKNPYAVALDIAWHW